ncbi:6715_t:CDS:2, partial [Acaulospora colombiana]
IFTRGSTPRASPPTHTTNNAHTTTAAQVGEEARSNATLPLYTPYPTQTMRQHNHDPFFTRLFSSSRSSPPTHNWSSMQPPVSAATDVQMIYVTHSGYGYVIPAEPPPAYTPPGLSLSLPLCRLHARLILSPVFITLDSSLPHPIFDPVSHPSHQLSLNIVSISTNLILSSSPTLLFHIYYRVDSVKRSNTCNGKSSIMEAFRSISGGIDDQHLRLNRKRCKTCLMAANKLICAMRGSLACRLEALSLD